MGFNSVFKGLNLEYQILTDTNVNDCPHVRLVHLHSPKCYYIRLHDVHPSMKVN